MKNPVNWFEIYVQDINRAKTFYQSMLSIELTKIEGAEFAMWGFPADQEGYGATGALIYVPGFSSGDNSVIIYFKCDDCAVEAEKAVKAGGKLHEGKKSIGQYGYIALVLDTEGNMVGLHSMQ